jgi:hypothetical protein
MKKLFQSFLVVATLFLAGSCEKETPIAQELNPTETHIKDIAEELELFAKAINTIIQDEAVVYQIKEAIYAKKKDENITLRDLFKYQPTTATHLRTESIEQLLLNALNQYQNMNLQQMYDIIDANELAVYWEFIQLWDGVTMPKTGYPTNEEEDVDNEYDLMSYQVFQDENDVIGEQVVRNYLYENPVILIRPLENFENGAEAYYSEQIYLWLYDVTELDSTERIMDNNSTNISGPTVLRLKEFTTNGNLYDGSGGPEFRFGRVGSENPLYNVSNFTHKITMNLSTSVASSTGWWKVNDDLGYSDILDYDWKPIKFNQHLGCYEQDGGLNNRVEYLYAKFIDIGGLISLIIDLNVGAGIRLQRNDDIIHRTILPRSTYVNYFLTGYNFEGVRNGKSIVSFNNEVSNNDLKIVLSDN